MHIGEMTMNSFPHKAAIRVFVDRRRPREVWAGKITELFQQFAIIPVERLHDFTIAARQMR